MYKHSKGLNKPCSEVLTRVQVVDMKIVMGNLRKSYDAPSGENLIILRNFQYWPKFLVSYKKICVLRHVVS